MNLRLLDPKGVHIATPSHIPPFLGGGGTVAAGQTQTVFLGGGGTVAAGQTQTVFLGVQQAAAGLLTGVWQVVRREQGWGQGV